jgi:hypothetical protein
LLTLLTAAVGAGASPQSAGAAESDYTTCANLCAGTSNPCVVAQTLNVVPGSTIDCGGRDVQVSGGDILVHDGQFSLIANSITVSNRHVISADCPQGTSPGFSLRTSGDVSIVPNSASAMKAQCATGGGVISIDASGDVTIAGTGINANGTARNTPGGNISIVAGGTLTTTAILTATTPSGGIAPGGQIALSAAGVSIGDDVIASGTGTSSGGKTGGSISIESSGDITLTDPRVLSLDAGTSGGNGGSISLEATGTIQCSRPLRARGTGNASAGGSISLEGEHVVVNGDVVASGGLEGGTLTLQSRGGTLEVGTGSTSSCSLDVSSGNGGSGGALVVASGGGDITLAAPAQLKAGSCVAGGAAGRIQVEGVSVTLASGSSLTADGSEGTVTIQGRDVMTLSGTVHATGGVVDIVYRTQTPTIGAGVSAGYTLSQDSTLPAPCGDGILRAGVEQCDDVDFGTQGCDGTLACTASCTLDKSGCR